MLRGCSQTVNKIDLQSHMPEWRNGRRGGLKIRWSQGRVGSTPSSGTIFLQLQRKQFQKLEITIASMQKNRNDGHESVVADNRREEVAP